MWEGELIGAEILKILAVASRERFQVGESHCSDHLAEGWISEFELFKVSQTCLRVIGVKARGFSINVV